MTPNERGNFNMVDINAVVAIEISVKNYEQVVKNDKGRFLGTVAKVPGASSFVKNKVDETIEKEVKENLEQALPERLADELTKELRENGVEASIDVSMTYP
jgi:hypothetical protein